MIISDKNFEKSISPNLPLIKINVVDTGDGIPEVAKKKLFQIFGSFDNEKGVNKFGIGLGLTIC